MKKQNGITLIALVITIIILIILAGVTINCIAGDNGIIMQASNTKKNYSKAEVKEKVELALSSYIIEKNTKYNVDFVQYMEEELSVGMEKNDDEQIYSFIFNAYEVIITENSIISIDEFIMESKKTFSSVQKMKKDNKLEEGDFVHTLGYYSKKLRW